MRLALIALLFIAALGRGQNPADASSLAILSGTVTSSATGELLRKASVELRPATGGPPYAVTSDSNGTFAFSDVAAGSYVLSASHPGYVSRNPYRVAKGSTITLASGQRWTDLAIKLTPGGVIAGHVLDQDGDPRSPALAGVFVQLMREARTTEGKKLRASGSSNTDAEGGFVFTGVPAGRYYVRATPQTRQNPQRRRPVSEESEIETFYPDTPDSVSAVPIDVIPGSEFRTIDIRIRKEHTVHVRGKVSVPISNLNVYLSPDVADSVAGPSVPTIEGKFDIADVYPGTYRIVALANSSGGIYFGRSTIVVDENGTDDLTLDVRRSLDVTGKFTIESQSDQTPQVPGWPSSPALRLLSNFFLAQPTAEIAADGSFRISNVVPTEQTIAVEPPPGMYVKSIRAGGQDITTHPVFDAGVSDPTLEIVLAPNAGEVVTQAYDADGMPVPGVSAFLWSKDSGREARGRIGQDNLMHFTNLAPGDYLLIAWDEGDNPLSDGDAKSLFESRATKVTVTEGGVTGIGVSLISSDDIDQALAKLN